VRDLVNTPANDMTPEILARRARDISAECRLSCRVLDKKGIEAEKMGLLLAVARGSENEPRFVHMHYKPAGKAKTKVALIGKGITFDTGGYDLKPGRYMINMKNDMAGAAICIAVMKVLSAFKPRVEVNAYLPLCDNMIDAKAEVPGNIVRSRTGKTVELISTDSEGRLILADAISYALDKKPDYIVDLATLTGGVLYALGEIYTAVLGNDQRFIDRYLAASKAENEHAWQLPLEKEYNKDAAEGPADLKNALKTKADTIGGALFLNEFVGDTKWFHLDIAESAWSEEEKDFITKGGTGTMVRTLVRLLMEM
jgi:leucyl aminopeptidase